MRVVFLDFDGVIVPFEKKYQKKRPAVASPGAVAALNKVLEVAPTRLVVTSSWRMNAAVEKLDACVRAWGLKAPVVGAISPKEDLRGLLALDWLKQAKACGLKVDSFVVVDDDPEAVGRAVEDRFVHVKDPMLGFTANEAAQAMKILEVKL